MRHPTPGELLELHFGEVDQAREVVFTAHVRDCGACQAVIADLEWAERALAAGPGDTPPADGLERVLARIESVPPARDRPAHGLRAALPSAGALLAGSLAVQQGGAVAALVFFAVGAIVTLSVAPVLILESQRRSR